MEKKACAFDGCDKPSRTRGFCQGHYCQFKKGQELRPLAKCMRGAPIEDRFMAKVRKAESCWEWMGGKHPRGYGHFTWSDRSEINAHRASYMLFKGVIPDDMTVDHICQNVGCVNPSHLRLATWTQQAQYKRRYKEHTRTGVRNVRPAVKAPGKFDVYVSRDGVSYYGGRFDTLREADIAAGDLRAELFDFKEKPIE